MTESKAWDWQNAEKEAWLKPSEESFYYAEKWRAEGRSRLLDLGCGLGRHSIFFDSRGFRVTAMDLSEYGIDHLREWKKKNGTDFRTVVGDMNKLPFADNAFDCIYSYHVISHTDTEGIHRVISEIRRVLRPGGEIFFDLCSKDGWAYTQSEWERIDENTLRFVGGVEDGIPHFFTDVDGIKELLGDFRINRIRHIRDIDLGREQGGGTHYFIEADVQKEYISPDYSDIIGKTVSGMIDRPLGSRHPRHPDLIYPINYGYFSEVIGGDGHEQDIYLFGVDRPVKEFSGRVIAVLHRYNDNEDKWIVSADGKDRTDEQIKEATDFQEKYFDGEIFR